MSPYSNQINPYSSQGSPWQNNNDFNNQKKLDNERRKLSYKMSAEESLDRIVRDYQNAMQNNLSNWHLDPADKAAVVRYAKRYWDNQFLAYSMMVLVLTLLLSFYTVYAVVGILAVFILHEAFSQRILLTYLLNDHELTRKQISDIKDKIFFKQLKTTYVAGLTFVLSTISYVAYLISTPVFLEPYLHLDVTQKVIQILSKWYLFHIENELFVLINMIAIAILMLLKLYEKWTK